jgi:hypothetical protein
MPLLVVPLPKQEKTHWCWVAVTQGIAGFYEKCTHWNQGKLINEIRGNRHYKKKIFAQFTAGVDDVDVDNIPGAIEDSLRMIQCYQDKLSIPSLPLDALQDFASNVFEQVKQQINRQRPVVCSLKARGGNAEGHIAIIVGYQDDAVLWREPGNPGNLRNTPSFFQFLTGAEGVAYVKYMIYTKPATENLNDRALVFKC